MPLAGSILARSSTVVPMSIVEPSASVRFGWLFACGSAQMNGTRTML